MKTIYKTVTETANLLDISTQAVYKKLKRLVTDDNQRYNELVTMVDGRKAIDFNGFCDLVGKPGCKLVGNEVGNHQPTGANQPERENEPSGVNEMLTSPTGILIESLREEIAYLRQENNKLMELLDHQQQITLTANLNTNMAISEPTDEPEHNDSDPSDGKGEKGFFRRFFR